VDDGLLPFKRRCLFVVDLYETVDRLTDLFRRGKANAPERLPRQNTEPAFDLVEPTRIGRRVVKMNVRMAVEVRCKRAANRTQLGEMDALVLARQLLSELVRGGEAGGQVAGGGRVPL